MENKEPGFLLQIVTAERMVFEGEVDIVNAPGSEGDLGLLPRHAPLMTTLRSGEIEVKQDKETYYFAVSGGFLEVRPDHVIILADSAERADEIDLARAQEAIERAKTNLADKSNLGIDAAAAEAALARALVRVKVAGKRRKQN